MLQNADLPLHMVALICFSPPCPQALTQMKSGSRRASPPILPEISAEQTFKRQVFIQFRPMQSIRRDLHIPQLGRRSFGKTRIVFDRKAKHHTTCHFDHKVRRGIIHFFLQYQPRCSFHFCIIRSLFSSARRWALLRSFILKPWDSRNSTSSSTLKIASAPALHTCT